MDSTSLCCSLPSSLQGWWGCWRGRGGGEGHLPLQQQAGSAVPHQKMSCGCKCVCVCVCVCSHAFHFVGSLSVWECVNDVWTYTRACVQVYLSVQTVNLEILVSHYTYASNMLVSIPTRWMPRPMMGPRLSTLPVNVATSKLSSSSWHPKRLMRPSLTKMGTHPSTRPAPAVKRKSWRKSSRSWNRGRDKSIFSFRMTRS